jgi:hypothetical protein
MSHNVKEIGTFGAFLSRQAPHIACKLLTAEVRWLSCASTLHPAVEEGIGMATATADQLECMQLAIAWAYHLDSRSHDRLLALFAEDGVLHSRSGVDAAGTLAIREILQSRDATRVTRHVLSAPFVEMTGPDDARAVSVFTVYDAMEEEQPIVSTLPLRAPVTVGEFHQTFRRTTAGWRIASSRSVPVFKRDALG